MRSASGYKVWMITKWYPNREDPQIGVFIQKHARAIAMHSDIALLYLHSTTEISNQVEILESETNGVKEITIYYCRSTNRLHRLINLFRYLSAARKGIKILKQKIEKPDLIHAYILTRTGVVAWFLSMRMRIPYVISEQWSGYITGKFSKSSLLKRIISRFVVRNASAVSAVSEYLKKKMIQNGLNNPDFSVISNTIEKTLPNINTVKHATINVLIVADLVDDIKNISSVIRMIGELGNNYPIQLKIVGGGRDEGMLKKIAADLGLLNDKIFFEGMKTNDVVYRYLSQCDFLVMNSHHETFSLICVEAMSCGKPVLATRCGGPEEFILEENGILIQPGNDTELKEKFTFMLNNFEKYDSIKIKHFADKFYSFEMASKKFIDLYSNLQKK